MNYTYHDENGSPVVDLTKFPDMKGMVDHAHALNLTAGFYSNNCKCADVRLPRACCVPLAHPRACCVPLAHPCC